MDDLKLAIKAGQFVSTRDSQARDTRFYHQVPSNQSKPLTAYRSLVRLAWDLLYQFPFK
jgi:hypothetical protein